MHLSLLPLLPLHVIFPKVISTLEVPEKRRFGAGKHRKEALYFHFLKSRLVPLQIHKKNQTQIDSSQRDLSIYICWRIPVTLGNCLFDISIYGHKYIPSGFRDKYYYFIVTDRII